MKRNNETQKMEARILAIGDVHGMDFPRLKELIKKHCIDFVLCTGDLTNADEYRKLVFDNWIFIAVLGIELHQLMGLKRYKKLITTAVKSQDNIIRRLGKLPVKTFLVYGNNDYVRDDAKRLQKLGIAIEPLEEKLRPYKNIILLKRRALMAGDIALIGHSGEYYRHHGTKKLLYERKSPTPIIFLTHEPPQGVMDKICMKASPLYGERAGNPLYLELVKKYKPLIHICGHIHEGFGKKRIGRTWILNLGSLQDRRYVIITIKKGKVSFQNKRL
jgi:Icc-related predicted phosphoesterase